MVNRLITIECDQATMDKMQYYAYRDLNRVLNGQSKFWTDYGFNHAVNGDTLYFLKEQWNEYKRDWKGTPGCDS